MTLTEEDKQWNDLNLAGIINPNEPIRVEATRNIISRINNDSNYILALLEYCLTVPIDNKNFKLALLVIGRLLKHKPSFFLMNFDGIQEQFFQLLNYISKSSSHIQILIGHIIVYSFEIIRSCEKEEISEKYLFYQNVFNISFENLNTLPLCFYMRSIILRLTNESNQILVSTIYKIITEYYPKEKDFSLLCQCLNYYTTQTENLNEINDECDIFSYIYELAVNSENFEISEFNKFWCSIQSINNRIAQPFVEKAFELLQKCESVEIKFSLLRFIEEHASLVLPEQVEAIIIIFYDSLYYNNESLTLSDFTIIEKLSCVDFDTFGLVYNLINQIYQRGKKYNYFIYLLSASMLTEYYNIEFSHVVPEVVENLFNLTKVSYEKNYSDLLLYLLHFFSHIMDQYSYIDCVKQIPIFLLNLIQPDEDQELIKYILLSIAAYDQSIDKQELFDKLLELFVSLYEKIDTSTAYFFFYALSKFLPKGRLFPENRYQVIHELVQYYIEQKNSNSNEQKDDDDACDILLSIFIFKMYIIDQQLYSELVEPAIHNLCTSALCINNNDCIEIVRTMADTIIEYLKIFKDEAYKLFKTNDYCSIIFQELSTNKNFEKMHPYMNVLSYIIKYSKDIFEERNQFYCYICSNIFKSKGVTFEKMVFCTQKFLFLGKGEENFAYLLKNIKLLISSSIESKDIERLCLLISMVETIIRPSHVQRHINMIQDDDKYKDIILPRFVEEMVNVASQLLELCSSSEKNFNLFIEPLLASFPSLCYYQNDIIHKIFELIVFRLTSADEKESPDITIKNINYLNDLAPYLIKYKVIQEEEFQFYVEFYQKILSDDEYFEVFTSIYISISQLIKYYKVEPIMELMPIFYQHWQNKIDNDEYFSILSTLFLMIFVKLSDNFDPIQVFKITEEICDRFKPLTENTNLYLKISIEFLSKYTNAPMSLKEKFLKNFITYLSYQKYCYYIFGVKEKNHKRLIEFLQETIPEMPNAQQIIMECFPDSPRALKGTLEMIGISYEE